MRALGQLEEARSYAILAYAQAWGDGPATHSVEDVALSAKLLATLEVEPPEVPTVDPADVEVPLANELQAYRDRVQAAKENGDDRPTPGTATS